MIKLYNNYIPHKKNCNFNKWFFEYEYQLKNLYCIMCEILEDRYNIENIKNISFINFCKFIYNFSSKYVMKY